MKAGGADDGTDGCAHDCGDAAAVDAAPGGDDGRWRIAQRDALTDPSGSSRANFRVLDPPADSASAYDREFSISLASREQRILNDVNAALSKIRNREYGTCELCALTIDETRLAAMPYARLCLACKERQEKPRKPG